MTSQNLLRRLWEDEAGANAVEYGLLAALVAVALIFAFRQFKDSIQNLFNKQSTQINAQ
jgi:pilus assembly protein Flp/PilA